MSNHKKKTPIKITVLVDNNSLIDSYFCAEPGVCYYIEADSQKILFDTGYSNIFIDNAHILNIDLTDITDLALSHGHNDHTWGLTHLINYYDRKNINPTHKKQLICHPDALLPKNYHAKIIGINTPKNILTHYFNCVETREPFYISEHVIFLGQIPRANQFEGKQPIGRTVDSHGHTIDDYVLDDSALAIKTDDGLIIVTGCSHAGICNIVDYAIKVTNIDKIVAVIGGFHLQEASEDILQQTGDYFSELQARDIYPCHCTDLAAKIYLSKYIPIKEVGVGLELSFTDKH